MVRIAAVAIACLVTVLAAVAKDVQIGPTTINLTLPSAYCELDDGNAEDASLLKVMGDLPARSHLLAAYADCKQLTGFRSGKETVPSDFAIYATPAGAMNIVFPDLTVKQVCAKLRTEGEQTLAGLWRENRLRVEGIIKGIKFNEMQFLGVMAEESSVCYGASLVKLKTDVGTEKVEVSLFANTIIRGKFIIFSLYAPYVGIDTVPAMLSKHKSNVATLTAANKN